MSEMGRTASERPRKFREQHGYDARQIPTVWIGQQVALNVTTGRGNDSLLGVTQSSGTLEAVNEDGYVLSVDDRIVFIPLHAVIQIELYDEDAGGSTLLFGRAE